MFRSVAGFVLATIILTSSCTDASTPEQVSPSGVSTVTPASPATAAPEPSDQPDPSVLRRLERNPVSPGFIPTSVAFADGMTGYLAGKVWCAGACPNDHRGQLAATHDGGATWHVVLRLPKSQHGLSVAANHDRVWVAVHGRLLSSDDGGRSWSGRSLNRTLTDLHAISAGDLVAIQPSDSGPWLTRSFDGGRTWHRVSTPCQEAAADAAFASFVDPNVGWLLCTGEGGAGNQPKLVARTFDGGATWTTAASAFFGADHGQIPTYGYGADLAFASDGSGWLVESRGGLLTTSDGGVTWMWGKGMQPEIDFGSGSSRIDPSVGYLLVDRGGMSVLKSTNDGGATWLVVTRWPRSVV